MDQKSAGIVVAVILILVVIILLIAYSYYPSCEYMYATPLVDAKAAQAAASKRGGAGEVMGNSPPRESDAVWLAWRAKHDAEKKASAPGN